jgi:hypothetical protein
MTASVFCLLLLVGQMNATKDVVRLPPSKTTIPQTYGGKLVELLNTAPEVSLPLLRPSATQPAATWSVEIRNLGPNDVTITNGNQLTVLLHPNQSTTIAARGPSTYIRLH